MIGKRLMCPAYSAIQIKRLFDTQEYLAQLSELTIIPFCITASKDIRVVVGDKHYSPSIAIHILLALLPG